MTLKLMTWSKGYSGVRPKLATLLLKMINKGILPIIPRQGSVGASGDLAPLSHIGCALIGDCLLYTSPSPRDGLLSRMPSSA